VKVYNFEQRSPEWFEIRKLKFTASHASEIATAGKGLETYIGKVVAESFVTEEKYSNADMERGVELESEAISIYELETGNIVTPVGFVEMDEHTGCSPDGLVGEDGGIEVKCHNAEVFLRLVCSDEIDTKYLWQIEMNLLITQRNWFDYIGYNPNFKPYIKRVYSDPTRQAKLLKGLEIGKAELFKRLSKAKAFMET